MASGEDSNPMMDECLGLFDFAERIQTDPEWERIFSRGDEGKIYRRPKGHIYEYLISGTLDGIDYQRFVLSQHDLEYRKKWDDHTLRCEVIAEDASDDSTTVYWLSKFPWPLANRDYVFKQWLRHLPDSRTYIAAKHAVEHPSKKPSSSPVRVVTYSCKVIAQASPDGKGVRYATLYCDDPGGSIPSSLINWAIKSAVPKYFDDIPGIVSKWNPK